jgi:hypothetical protein
MDRADAFQVFYQSQVKAYLNNYSLKRSVCMDKIIGLGEDSKLDFLCKHNESIIASFESYEIGTKSN